MAGRTKATLVERIIMEEFQKAHDAAEVRVREVLQKEFDRLHKKYPKLQRVIFGNGEYILCWEEKRLKNALPKEFDSFQRMCSDAAYYRYVAVTGSDLSPSEKK